MTTTDVAEASADTRSADKRSAIGVAWSRVKRIVVSVHVEPLVCVYILSRTLILLATQNLSIQKACRVNMQLGNDICAALDVTKDRGNASDVHGAEVAAQRLVTDMFVWQLIVQSSVPCVLAVFVGSWSDRNRKRVPCILFPMASELVRIVGLIACVYFFQTLSMEFVGLVEAVPTSFTGGRMVLFNSVFSYIGDVTKEESKTLRIGIVNLLSTLGMAIGTALSGITFRKLGFYGVYYTSSALCLVGLLYGVVFVKEVPKTGTVETRTEKKNINFLNDFFDVKHVKTACKTTFKEGPHNRKLRIIMLMCIAFLVMGPLNGELSIQYLNTRVRFNWNEVDFSVFSTYSMITNIIGTALSIGLLSRALKVDDGLIGVMACSGKIVAGLFYAFATTEKVYYLGPLVDIMGGTIFITTRSIMAKIVQPDELGQVTAIYGIVESLVPIIFGPLYSLIYNHTLNILPGAYNLVGSTLAIPATLIYLWMYQESKRAVKFNSTEVKVDVHNQENNLN